MRLDAQLIKQIASDAGLDGCGISKASVKESHSIFLSNWLRRGYNASMTYMSKNLEVRSNPSLLVENAKTVISVILSYVPKELIHKNGIKISKYAYGPDYHEVLKSKMEIMLGEIKKEVPEIDARIFIDTAPVLERYFAMAAGLGFIGNNTCLITEKYGSLVFIGEIVCDVESSEYDLPIFKTCGECQSCILACPTGALSENGLDANKCISYHTIENRGSIPSDIALRISNQVFGCDICQDACPYNKAVKNENREDFEIHSAIKDIDFNALSDISNREFNRRFAGTSLLRAGRKKLVENYSVIRDKNKGL